MNSNDDNNDISNKIKNFMNKINEILKNDEIKLNNQELTIINNSIETNDIARNILSFIENKTDIHHIPEIIYYIYNIYNTKYKISNNSNVRVLIIINIIIRILIECDIKPFSGTKDIINIIDNVFLLLETNINNKKSKYCCFF